MCCTAPHNEAGLLSTDELLNLVHHHDQTSGLLFPAFRGIISSILEIPFACSRIFRFITASIYFLALFYICSILSSLYVPPVYSATLVSSSFPLIFFLQIEHANGLDQSLSIRRGTLKQTKIPMSCPESKGEYDMLARGIKPESRKEKI